MIFLSFARLRIPAIFSDLVNAEIGKSLNVPDMSTFTLIHENMLFHMVGLSFGEVCNEI